MQLKRARKARLHEKAVDEKSWRAAVREWAEKVSDHTCGTVLKGLEG